MEDNKRIESVLKLNKIIFDKIEFNRLGLKNENEFELEIQSNIAQRENSDIYKVTLILKGKKPEEYTLEISLSGFFGIDFESGLSEELKTTLITKKQHCNFNAVFEKSSFIADCSTGSGLYYLTGVQYK